MISKNILLSMIDVPMGWKERFRVQLIFHTATFHFNFPGMSQVVAAYTVYYQVPSKCPWVL